MHRQAILGRDIEPLARNVQNTWPPSLGAFPGMEDLASLLSVVDAAVAQVHASQTREGVHKWQQAMAKCGRQATAWLRGRHRVITCVTAHDVENDGGEAVSIGAGLHNLKRFLRTIWQRNVSETSPAVLRWREHGRRARFEGRLASILTAENLAQGAKLKAGNAAGIDGWSGDEIASWPQEAWDVFVVLLLRWLRRGRFPTAWQQSRQVHLPKDEPSLEAGSLRADQLRPIAVLSSLWRTAGSCIARHPTTQKWLARVVDDSQVGGIHGRHLFMGLATVTEPFQSDLAVGSLDSQKCSDYIRPALVCDVLSEAGMPQALVQALRVIWDQTRFLELNGYVHKSGEKVNASMPQGDALSPLALNVLLSAPSREVRTHFGADFHQSVFLDDRVLACSPSRMPAALQRWDGWSRLFGLLENRRKQAFVCRSSSGRQELQESGLGPWLQPSVRVLGVYLVAEPGVEAPTAKARLDEALRRGRKLVNRALPLNVRRELWRTRIVPRASWGHIFSSPREHGEQHAEDLLSLLKQVTFSHRIGSKPLRLLLEGHVMCTGFMAGMNCLRTWRACGRAEALARQTGAGDWFRHVIDFLAGHGWRHEADATFVADGQRVDFLTEGPAAADHKVRLQWRKHLFRRFVGANRRDSQALAAWIFNEKQVEGARRLYKAAAQDGKAVLVGAALSTAFYRKQKPGVDLCGCEWCGMHVVPSWDHLVWHCSGMPQASAARGS